MLFGSSSAKTDFDRAIEPYLRLPEARAYKVIMHRYIATAETRNNKILEHDRTVTEIVQIATRVMFERMTVSRLTATTAENFDARLSENLAFLATSLSSLKWQLVRQLVSMEKSLEYMTGEPSRTAYADFSVAALQVPPRRCSRAMRRPWRRSARRRSSAGASSFRSPSC